MFDDTLIINDEDLLYLMAKESIKEKEVIIQEIDICKRLIRLFEERVDIIETKRKDGKTRNNILIYILQQCSDNELYVYILEYLLYDAKHCWDSALKVEKTIVAYCEKRIHYLKKYMVIEENRNV